MSQLKRTPIFPAYEQWGAKTIDFGGWDLPVNFSAGLIKEHNTVRNNAGLFDVSHMGEIFVNGLDSLSFLQKVMTNDLKKLEPNKALYTFMCQEDGGTIDDLLVYMLDEHSYMLVVNAANTDKDLAWLEENVESEEVSIQNKSDDYALLAVQGPKATNIVQSITEENLGDIKPFRFKQDVTFNNVLNKAIISRTGYTGEDGFEIYIHTNSALSLWQLLMKTGEEEGMIPAGLGARDSLRFEAGLPLYGQELSVDISPIEAGLSFAVKPNKEVDFVGKEVLTKQMKEGTNRKLIGLELKDKGIARTDHEVLNEAGEKIGYVTTGTKSPTLNKAIAFALLETPYTEEGQSVYIQVRKRQLEAVVIQTPFYKR